MRTMMMNDGEMKAAKTQARTHTRFRHRLTTVGKMMTMMMNDREMKAAETAETHVQANTHTLQPSGDDNGEDDDDDDERQGNEGR